MRRYYGADVFHILLLLLQICCLKSSSFIILQLCGQRVGGGAEKGPCGQTLMVRCSTRSESKAN